jgi:c-di-GMP-binding flagellar brake protein YcgR
MRDISEGGLSFNMPHETAKKLRKGDKLNPFRFTLPGAAAIETKVVVRNIFQVEDRKFTCGVEFIELTNEQLSEIYTYVVDRQRDKIKRQAKAR